MNELLAVGRIARAHGVHGEVAVHPLSEVEARFTPGSVLRLEDGRTLTVDGVRSHGRRLLVTFGEVADRTAAEALRGEVLLVPAEQSPALDEADRYWIHQVVGLEVVTESGRSLGTIREVLANPANDVWVTDGGTLVPAVRDVVLAVDLDGGRVTIRELPGLVEEA